MHFGAALVGAAQACFAGYDAITEIVRVLRSGGWLALIDIRHATMYAAQLRAADFEALQVGWPNFLFVIPRRSVIAGKPP